MNNEKYLLTDEQMKALRPDVPNCQQTVYGCDSCFVQCGLTAKAQLAHAEPLIRAEERARIRTEFKDNFQDYIESTNDGFIFHEDKWQALWEGK